ncbi:hypothetical protein P5G51_014890 [Virgibacillus sp. 179-BFC.A HS]|uniref:Uncharacterized protein n=1 Tax=Tigheibacillus jepli TaxID=3035914 RepID=A0ABU5CJF1_9BACI|nr:hypothetical protein [Virgibacillus sp. 179-BFC.A HS]MDY0406477.1 hypothetical protein [Virgibacillus sp. 179-BFC.A HS]
MAAASKLMSVGVIAFSFVIGFATLYLLSPAKGEQKRKYMEELISQLINFIIFIWVGKIILHFSIFVTDPLAILAYPSDSGAFYFAVLGVAIVLLYKSKQHKTDMRGVIQSFIPVFLVASFTYEFIQLVWNDNTYAFARLIVQALLLVLWFSTLGRVQTMIQFMVLLTGWTIGMLVLWVLQPYVSVFGYIMAPWFIGLFFIFCMLFNIWTRRKRGYNGWN